MHFVHVLIFLRCCHLEMPTNERTFILNADVDRESVFERSVASHTFYILTWNVNCQSNVKLTYLLLKFTILYSGQPILESK